MNIPESAPVDPRNPGELAADWADQQIVDFLMDVDVLRVEGDRTFTRDQLLHFIRAAWTTGALSGARSPAETFAWFEAYEVERRRLLEERQRDG